MGRGKSWSREESEAVAKAWKQASEVFSPREQNSKRFANELYQRFLDLAPTDPGALDGRWTSRSQTAVKTQFDAIGDDILKFNVVMSSVIDQAASHGVDATDEKVFRAAVGVHLGAAAGVVNFDDVNSVESDWKLFEAWKVLKTCPRFTPPNWPGIRGSGSAGNDEDPGPTDNHQHQHPQSSPIDNENHSFMQADNLPSAGGTPMRTLASAALSMPLVSTGMPHMSPLASSPSPGGEPQSSPQRDAQQPGPTANGQRPGQPLRALGKRSAEEMLDNANVPKEPRFSAFDMLSSGSSTMELIGHALRALGDALSEYNALALFSRPDMEGRLEQKMFLEALAEKHALKAKLDRDKLLNEVQQKRHNPGSNTFSE